MQFETVLRLAAKALRAGGRRTSLGRVEWEIAGNCHFPVLREVEGTADRFWRSTVITPGKLGVELREGFELQPGQRHLTVALTTRCRKCQPCLRQRRNEWVARAKREWAASRRTWFCTFTFRPEEHYRKLLEVREALRGRGVSWDDLNETQRFSKLHAAVGRELTLFLKRLRDGYHDDDDCGVKRRPKVRYMQVVEKHREALSGFPHYHVFIHESDEEGLTYAQIRRTWGYVGNDASNAPGFLEAKLVKAPAAAKYLTKYLGKSADARVRASSRYGSALFKASEAEQA